MSVGAWYLDDADCWIFDIAPGVRVWIQARPPYCDRGHWVAHVDGIRSIDDADSFPRYYMSLERAKEEMQEWLVWRLMRERAGE